LHAGAEEGELEADEVGDDSLAESRLRSPGDFDPH
jgi:hypothetical protein